MLTVVGHVERVGSNLSNNLAPAIMLNGVFSRAVALEDTQIGFAVSALESSVSAPPIEDGVKDS